MVSTRKRDKVNGTCTTKHENNVINNSTKKSITGNKATSRNVMKKSIDHHNNKLTKNSKLTKKHNGRVWEDDVDGVDESCFSFDDEMTYINNVIENLLKTSEATSLIICGDASIGKTTLVKNCLASFPVLMGKADDSDQYRHLKVALFKFDGTLHGNDDLSTIRLIGRRLNQFLNQQQNKDIDNDVNSNFNDDEKHLDEMQLSEKVLNSIPTIMALFRMLTENYENFRSIIVLDNFEIFCKKQQTLLYNLLDLTQHGRSILVIGITRRLDYLELLEKRVRSRLTQRIVHLMSPFPNLDSYKKYCFSRIKQLCNGNMDLEANFKTNLNSIENELAKSFSINGNFEELNRIILEYSFDTKPENKVITDGVEENKSKSTINVNDKKIMALSHLKKNDLILLIIVIRNLKDQDMKIFTCAQLYQWSNGVTLLRKARMGLIIKSIYNLIESDLVITEAECCRRKTSKNNLLCVNKWTKLVPNVCEEHLNEFMKHFEHQLPQSIKRLM